MNEKTADHSRPATNAPAAPSRRKRRPKYAATIYGARLPREDARLLDEYAAAQGLARSAVVRLAVRQFTLRQQLKVAPPDPLAKLVEEAVARQIAPMQQVVAGLQPLLARLFQELFERLRPAR